MWKAFQELAALGWLEDAKMPKLFACQSSGCAPIVDAFDAGERFAKAPANPHTIASGLRVPVAVGDFMILDAVRASGGRALRADEERILEWMDLGARSEGLSICPETAVCIGALEEALRLGFVGAKERIVIFNTGATQKYVEVLAAASAARADHGAKSR
jgi:threonine synthase